MQKLSANAAIAQPVERILGKDEVASSNLASSSIKKPETPTSFRLSSFLRHMVTITETGTKTDTGRFCLLNFGENTHQDIQQFSILEFKSPEKADVKSHKNDNLKSSTIQLGWCCLAYRRLRITPQAIFLPALPAGWV